METKPIIIGIGGGSGSGKTFMTDTFISSLQKITRVYKISQDWFYRELGEGENPEERNWDHPDSFDWELMRQTMRDIKDGLDVIIHTYDYNTHKRIPGRIMKCSRVVIFEGIFALYDEDIRSMFTHSIYMDCDQDIAICRRIRRDISERGRNIDDIIRQYKEQVKPSFEHHIKHTKLAAEFIICSTVDDHLVNNQGWKSILKLIKLKIIASDELAILQARNQNL